MVDEPAGSRLLEVARPPASREVSFLTVLHGWPADAERWLLSVFAHHGGHDFEAVLVDNSGDARLAGWLEGRAAQRLRRQRLDPPVGFAAAVNAGLEAAAGEAVILCDPGVEFSGDVAGPLLAALAQPDVKLAGAFGVRGQGSLKEFGEHPGPEVDAVEGYCMAFRRADALAAGGFDPWFRFYRIADIEFSFRMRAAGGRALVVPNLPVHKHAHRLWEAAEPAERDRLSKRNLYRFLDRWGKRADLLLRD
ncbi:MAG TPA: glycosyltransferase [Candidatus Acidoferrales bacterium]|nr:glycosyltransferase [Candidatus Acidoferrales bacterium]